ncbi:MAG: hypothetical protein AAFR35_13200 [Pseudomonadota bacterium]
MKLIAASAIMVLAAGASAAQTITREGTHGTSVINRTVEDGTSTATGTWTGKNGRTYDRATVCSKGICTTDWNGTGRSGGAWTGNSETVFDGSGSTTTAFRTGPNGRTSERTVRRNR